MRRATKHAVYITFKCGNFYPRPPCGGRRKNSVIGYSQLHNFYPRPPCGGRPGTLSAAEYDSNFYPRPPCGGRPGGLLLQTIEYCGFLSTPSVRRATDDFGIADDCDFPISIHALRAEGDAKGRARPWQQHNFYPRPPCGGRRRCKHAKRAL